MISGQSARRAPSEKTDAIIGTSEPRAANGAGSSVERGLVQRDTRTYHIARL